MPITLCRNVKVVDVGESDVRHCCNRYVNKMNVKLLQSVRFEDNMMSTMVSL